MKEVAQIWEPTVSIDCSSLWKAAEGLLENVPGGSSVEKQKLGPEWEIVAVTGSRGLIGSLQPGGAQANTYEPV